MTIPTRTETIKKTLPGGGKGQTYGHLGVGQSIYAQTLTPTTTIGARLKVGNRTFHYSRTEGGVTAGKMAVYACDTDAEAPVTVAHPITTTELTITAASTIVKDQYAEGMLIVHQGTGLGDQYVIKSHPGIASSSTGVITIYEPGLLTAWVIANTDITLWANPYMGVAQSSSTASAGAGVPLIDTTDQYYFWLQTWGPAGALIKDAGTSGTDDAETALGVNTAGDLYKQTAGQFQCAHILEVASDVVGTNADFGYVFLTCDP